MDNYIVFLSIDFNQLSPWISNKKAGIAGLVDVAQSVAMLAVKRLDSAAQFNQHGAALAVQRLAGGNLDPAFADAVFLDVEALFAIESDADVALQHIHIVVRAAWINRQTVGQWWECGGIVHPVIIHQIGDPYNGARPRFTSAPLRPLPKSH
jgi:hypothetical protein